MLQIKMLQIKPFRMTTLNVRRKQLGNLLKQKREELNLSQEGAAAKVEITRQQWIRLENGQSGTKQTTIFRIAEKLGFNAEETNEALQLAAGYAPKNEQPKIEIDDSIALVGVDGDDIDEQDLAAMKAFIAYTLEKNKKKE
jgi:transcriptional regulator with XRE-family HTH domain